MSKYERLLLGYEQNKPIIDYARTITTFFAWATIVGASIGGLNNLVGMPLALTILFWFSIVMFVILALRLMYVCSYLTFLLLLDIAKPEKLDQPWRGIVHSGTALFSLAINAGGGGIVGYTIGSLVSQ